MGGRLELETGWGAGSSAQAKCNEMIESLVPMDEAKLARKYWKYLHEAIKFARRSVWDG